MSNISEHNIVFDLEATCWDMGRDLSPPDPYGALPNPPDPEDVYKQNNEMETIQIGAYKVHYKTFEIIDSFDVYVRPVRNPKLTQYCMDLTGISQADVAGAGDYYSSFPTFLEWADDPRTFIGWGQGDFSLLYENCAWWHKHLDVEFRCFPRYKYVNGKSLYQYWKGIRSKGLAQSVKRAKLEFEGRHHNALADAYMTVKVLREAWMNF